MEAVSGEYVVVNGRVLLSALDWSSLLPDRLHSLTTLCYAVGSATISETTLAYRSLDLPDGHGPPFHAQQPSIAEDLRVIALILVGAVSQIC